MNGWSNRIRSSLRRACAGVCLLAILGGGIAHAQISTADGSLVPIDFYNAPIDPKSPATISADGLSFDAATGVITATGNVVFGISKYVITGQKLVFNRKTNDVHFEGGVVITDPSGNQTNTENLDVTGGMKKAVVAAFTITGYDGSRITADDANYDSELQTILTNSSYSPCGDCIDSKGRRIGWSVQAKRITSNADGSVYIEQPQIDLLGIPVAWLPFLYLPDTSNSALSKVPRPTLDSSDETGLIVTFPFRVYSSRSSDVIFTPALITGQGFMLGAEWVQRFETGGFSIKATGIRQFNPDAFSGSVGDTEWRGAIQSSGAFKPIKDWTVGWSYTAFTDAAFLGDYKLDNGNDSVTQVYATEVTPDTYVDARLQTFNQLGNVTSSAQAVQGQNLPVVEFNHITRLGDGKGEIDFSGDLLGMHRDADSKYTANGLGYVEGYSGNKIHATFEAGWRDQWIGGGGFVASPYLGVRADAAYYDGTSVILPGATSLFSVTPIAAMDVRFPLSASDGSTVHLVEPIAQLVYRGSDNATPGITNDNSQSFVFDDTNLFSYNRFSGSDRQETGLRANIGGQYQVSAADGAYLSLIAGESFQLAGVNAFASADQMHVGAGSGLDTAVSYAVLGAYASLPSGFSAGGKLQVDSSTLKAKRAGLSASFARDGYSAGLNYLFVAANPALGITANQHEIGGAIGVPVADYWTVTGNAYWDLTAANWLQAGVGLQYDDGYLAYGANFTRTGPTNTTPNDTRFVASFKLKAPAGFGVGYTRQ